MTCPANPVKSEETGSNTGQLSHTQEQGGCQTLQSLESLLSSLVVVAESMAELTQSNLILAQAISEALAGETTEEPATMSMDGARIS